MTRTEKPKIASVTLVTPIGRLEISASPQGLREIVFNPHGHGHVRDSGQATTAGPKARRHLTEAVRQLREYFAGRRSEFELPLDVSGTAYQQRVWGALQAIPFGKTLSYGEVAARMGVRGGARAVGRACATNPVPVVVPCHRVIGGDGALHGYDGGLWRKQRLLEFERGTSKSRRAGA